MKNTISHFSKLFFVIFFISVLFSSCTNDKEKEPYNVLFIAVDDLRPELGYFGEDHIISPNIDRLASESALFRRAYCNVPVCGASRASLLSGLRPTRHRFLHYYSWSDKEAPGIQNLPGYFKEHGYYTASFGKIYHHPSDNEQAWDTIWNPSTIGSWRDYVTEKNILLDTTPGQRGFPFEMPDAEDNVYRDGKLAEGAIKTLKELKERNKPFFLGVGFWKPHLPFNAPKKYWDLYDEREIHLPKSGFRPVNAPDEAFHNSGELRHYNSIPGKGFLNDTMAQKLIHGYYACVSYTDAQIGKVLNALKESGLEKNTIVVLWGDHGWNLREHGLWCKHCNFETSLHTPLIIKRPGLEPLETDEIVEFVDIYPTLCELAELEIPDHVEGRSMVNMMMDPAAKGDGVAVCKWFDGVTTITGDYFYTEWINDSDSVYAKMLYNHASDPQEMINLASEADYDSLMDSLAVVQREHRGEGFWDPSLVSPEELK
jgi:arylsulfatase A-like enzyme